MPETKSIECAGVWKNTVMREGKVGITMAKIKIGRQFLIKDCSVTKTDKPLKSIMP